MENHPSPATRELGKLISALRKQWLEELGSPEAAATESALRNAEQVLATLKAGTPPETVASDLEQRLGAEWLAVNPWASPFVKKLAGLLSAAAST